MADIAGRGSDPGGFDRGGFDRGGFDRAGFDRAALEAQLLDLGRHLDLPPAPDLTSAVLARLDQPRTAALSRRGLRMALAALAALVLVAAVTPAGQAAVARVVHAFGVVLRWGEPQAPARPEQLPGETSTALERARRQVAFPVVVPATLGRPDEVTVSDGGRVLSLIYRAGPGRPAAGPGGISARLDEFDGAVDVVFLKQLSGAAEWLDLPNGDFAVWIDTPHDVTYLDRSGTEHTETSHLSGHTLIWTITPTAAHPPAAAPGRGTAPTPVTLRLEGDFTKEEARAIATGTVPTAAPSP